MSGRSIIVTGGFGALGRVVAAAFSAQADRVARVDFAPVAPDAIAGGLDIGGVDLSDAGAAASVAAQVTEAFGGIDTLVNIAGGFVWGRIRDGDIATWERMYRLNALTCLTMTKAALPALQMRPSARIINIGSGGGLKGETGMGAYAASKAAVHRLTESVAAELAQIDITVNAVLPGIIDTPANRKDMPDADFTQWVQPQAIAETILFLASPAASAVTGALIPVTRRG